VYTYITFRTKENPMQEQPEPTREEDEQAPAAQEEQEAMRGPGHEDPPDVEEIHDA
jgi:hypothetical protein